MAALHAQGVWLAAESASLLILRYGGSWLDTNTHHDVLATADTSKRATCIVGHGSKQPIATCSKTVVVRRAFHSATIEALTNLKGLGGGD